MRRSTLVAVFLSTALSACSHGATAPWLPAGSFGPELARFDEAPGNTAFRPVYSFGKIAGDGAAPQSAPIAFNGEIYGTTTNGGSEGIGTIFSVTSKGVEKIRHDFKGTDGSQPSADTMVSNNVLYGTTYVGGKFGFGTVFSLSRTGTLKTLHSFENTTADGGFLQGGLVKVGTEFYGTTEGGGANGDGTLFSIKSTGHERLIHSFSGSDGLEPGSTLIAVNGVLYGTTFDGGKFNHGTVFRATLDGQVKVLHSFADGSDGALPFDRLVNLNGVLYGTTGFGGTTGNGTVFKITLGGKEQVIYSFDGSASGCDPMAGLTPYKGVMYGTTFGIADSHCSSHGTVFRITANGSETTLHTFGGGQGGGNPYGGLGVVGKKLYGTTQNRRLPQSRFGVFDYAVAADSIAWNALLVSAWPTMPEM